MSGEPSNSPRCPCCGAPVDPSAVMFDAGGGVVGLGGETANLTKLEVLIFGALLECYPATVQKDRLYDRLYTERLDCDGPDPKILDVKICHLRRKLDRLGLVIETAWGFGYRLVIADPLSAQSVRDTAARSRGPKAPRWGDLEDQQLRELVERRFGLSQIATTMGRPYAAVTIAMDRLGLSRAPERVAAE